MSVTLGPGPVVIPLTQWTEESISALYNATTQTSFNSALDAFLLKDAHITVNGKHLTRDQYKQLLQGEQILERSAEVSFNGSVEVSKNPDEPAEAGNVGLFYTVTVIEKVNVFGAPATSTVTSSLNVTIVEDGGVEDRKVKTLNQVVAGHANPIHPPTASTSN